jgi:hypothetical protein
MPRTGLQTAAQDQAVQEVLISRQAHPARVLIVRQVHHEAAIHQARRAGVLHIPLRGVLRPVEVRIRLHEAVAALQAPDVLLQVAGTDKAYAHQLHYD